MSGGKVKPGQTKRLQDFSIINQQDIDVDGVMYPTRIEGNDIYVICRVQRSSLRVFLWRLPLKEATTFYIIQNQE
jgi:hypothetical protein